MESKDKVNREYKNSVFVDLFYEDETAKENELALYNALFGTNYTLEEIDIVKNRVDNVIYMGLKNDVSFNVGDRVLVFSEHQSTINGNMPLRDLMYVAKTYENNIPVRDRYKAKTVLIPKPEFFVFYNGKTNLDTEYELKLSDAYIDKGNEDNLSLELKVKVININSKAGNDILKRCKILNEYTLFVEKVRELKDLGIPKHMEEAIKYCIENHILEEYLSRKGSEVMGFLCAEYDHEMALEVRGEEKYEDGFNDGVEQGIERGIERGVQQGEKRVYKLIEKLIQDNRNTEIEKITKDEDYRKKLYEEYGL